MRWLAGVCLVALVALSVAVLRAPEPRIVIHNASGLALEDVQVWIGDQKAQMAALTEAPGEGQILPTRMEGPIRARLRFADGRQSELQAGWFSPGMDGTARLTVVSPDSIHFELR